MIFALTRNVILKCTELYVLCVANELSTSAITLKLLPVQRSYSNCSGCCLVAKYSHSVDGCARHTFSQSVIRSAELNWKKSEVSERAN